MSELIAYLAPILALAGLTCGWIADTMLPARGYGLRGDMGLGFAGSLALAFVLYISTGLGGVGLLPAFLIGFAGAAVVITAQRTFWQNRHLLAGPASPDMRLNATGAR